MMMIFTLNDMIRVWVCFIDDSFWEEDFYPPDFSGIFYFFFILIKLLFILKETKMIGYSNPEDHLERFEV